MGAASSIRYSEPRNVNLRVSWRSNLARELIEGDYSGHLRDIRYSDEFASS
jgi:hypothetical protein